MSTTHLVGTRDVTAESGLATVDDLGTEPWALGEIDVVHVNYEISQRGMHSTIPPALHPSIPPHLSWLVYRVADSEFGPFALAQTRVGCRIGIKPRGLLVSAVCDNPRAAEALRTRWGFRVVQGEVVLRPRNDRVEVEVSVCGTEILALDVVDPRLLAGAGVPIAAGLNLADTPEGRQLLQVDPDYVIVSADRGRPLIRSFDAAAWGDADSAADIVPSWPISGSHLRAEVTLPRLRYLTDPTDPSGRTVRLPAVDTAGHSAR
jgi:hypothetical protein